MIRLTKTYHVSVQSWRRTSALFAWGVKKGGWGKERLAIVVKTTNVSPAGYVSYLPLFTVRKVRGSLLPLFSRECAQNTDFPWLKRAIALSPVFLGAASDPGLVDLCVYGHKAHTPRAELLGISVLIHASRR